MAAFCSGCGKPLEPGAKFCGGCGTVQSSDASRPAQVQAAPAQPAVNPGYATPVKSGSPVLKILLVVVLVGGAVVVMAAGAAFYFGKKKLDEYRARNGGATAGSSSASESGHHASRSHDSGGSYFLSNEEVGEIIGIPVTKMTMQGESDAKYETATMGMEASIEVERKHDEDDAIQDLAAARQVTRGFGGKGDKVEGLGDDAVYGAYNTLYVRKGDIVMNITPPNLQMAAQLDQHNKMMSQPLGSDAQLKEMEKFQAVMKGDPGMKSLSKPDAMSGAVDLIGHAATESGNEYETKARLMARQMAEKVLAKIGA